MAALDQLLNLLVEQNNRFNPGNAFDYSKPRPTPPAGKYPNNSVGVHYWGEAPGYVYSPIDDKYHPSTAAYKNFEESTGLVKPPPSTLEQLTPALALLGGRELIGNAGGLLKGGAKAISGLFGGGGDAAETGSLGLPDLGAADPVSGGGEFTLDSGAEAADALDSGGGGFASGGGGAGGADALGADAAADSGLGLGNILPGVGAAFGAYNTADALQHGGKGLQSGLTETGAGLGSYAGPLGTLGGAAVGEATGYGLKNENNAKGQATLAALGPMGWGYLAAHDLFGFDAIHQSTKDIEKSRWGSLGNIPGIANAESAVHPIDDTSVYQSGPHAGQKWDFSTANQDAIKTPWVFNDELGNYQTFGADWNKYTQDQKNQIITQLAQKGLYKGDHGDVVITDPDQAKAIRDQVITGDTQADSTAPKSPADALTDNAPDFSSTGPSSPVGSLINLGAANVQPAAASTAPPATGGIDTRDASMPPDATATPAAAPDTNNIFTSLLSNISGQNTGSAQNPLNLSSLIMLGKLFGGLAG